MAPMMPPPQRGNRHDRHDRYGRTRSWCRCGWAWRRTPIRWSRRSRCAARLARDRAGAVPHAHDEAVRDRRRRRPVDHRAHRRHHPRRGRHRGPRLPRGAADLRRRRCPRRRHPRALPPWHVPRDRLAGAGAVHPARPQPDELRRDRRQAHGVRPELRLAVRARPRPRPPLRHPRRLPELREARLHDAVVAPLGRHRVRTRRRARQQAPPRHGVQPHQVQRQGVHGLGHRRIARRRTASTWPASRSVATCRTAPS